MATRSTIAVLHVNGKVSQIYCHSDGYLSHNGSILNEHYNSLELAEAVVALGDISSLGERLNPIGEHSFTKREEGTTVYYGRDRLENDIAPKVFDDVKSYEILHDYQEFEYIFKNGNWYVEMNDDGYMLLSDAMAR